MEIVTEIVRRVNAATISLDSKRFAWSFRLANKQQITLVFEQRHLEELMHSLAGLCSLERQPTDEIRLGELAALRVKTERVLHAIGKCERVNDGELEVQLHFWIHDGPGRSLVMTDKLFSVMAGGVVTSAELLKPKRRRLGF